MGRRDRATGQGVEDRQGRQKCLRRRALDQAEGRADGHPLRIRECLEGRQYGLQQLVETGERQACLGLDPDRREHLEAHLAGEPPSGPEQARLPDTRLANQHHRTAGLADTLDRSAESEQLLIAADQL